MLGFNPVVDVLLIIVSQLIFLIPAWKMATKLGYPGYAALILWVPVVNLVVMYYVAFGETPLERELNSLRD